jgi:hypothetical protein
MSAEGGTEQEAPVQGMHARNHAINFKFLNGSLHMAADTCADIFLSKMHPSKNGLSCTKAQEKWPRNAE